MLAIIGDYNVNFKPHIATNEAIDILKPMLDFELNYEWVATDSILTNWEQIIHTYKAFWIAPGSPYNSMEGVLKLIKYARENSIPTLGTCGGFQHMAIEFARSVMQITDAEHAEYNPYASEMVVNPLSCKLIGQKLDISLIDPHSLTYKIYNNHIISEKYYCNFGLNPVYQEAMHQAGFQITGTDLHHEARILELKYHPFFIATLFVPQDNCTSSNPNPLVLHFLQTCK